MRIISGTARGRKLKTLAGQRTRPTSDKVKGAIFNVLGEKVGGARVLDLFAGSGALGLEALSRGAGCAVLVEKNNQACQIIWENMELTGFTSRARLVNRDGLVYLQELSGQTFDLVFLDPPYNQGLAFNSLKLLAKGTSLAANGVIIVETSREEQLPVELGNLGLRKNTRYGDTMIWYYQPTETEDG